MILVGKIRVINPRARGRAKFTEIVTNISKIGLKKPITVKPRADAHGEFDLVCGQGRFEACIALEQTHVPAIVLDVSAEDAYLMSLVENIARRMPTTLELVQKIDTLEKRGYSPGDIAKKVGVSESYVRSLLRLYKQGEERLLAAVERGEIPIGIAAEIAATDDQGIQRSLAEAYESGKLRGKSLMKARNLVEARRTRGKRLRSGGNAKKAAPAMSADKLVRTYQRETQRQTILVRKAQICEQRLLFLASSLRALLQDDNFVNVLRAESLDKMPEYLAKQIKAGGAT